jgi:hypothetical protein
VAETVLGDRDGLEPLPLFPGVSNLNGQVQAVDAGVVTFQVGPEPSGEQERQLVEAAVIHRGLAFRQVTSRPRIGRQTMS